MKLPDMSNAQLEEITGLIDPKKDFPWLKKHLESFGHTLWLDTHVHAVQPTKVGMRRMMLEIESAAGLLLAALRSPGVFDFLQDAGNLRIENLGGLEQVLRAIKDRAPLAAKTIAKRGPGKAISPHGSTPQTLCAIIIAETWKFCRGQYPGQGNRAASKAVDLYWRACGGKRRGWGGDVTKSWAKHFAAARKGDSQIAKELRSHLLNQEFAEKQHAASS